MDKRERKEVNVSAAFNEDIAEVYAYGEELFGRVAAKSFVSDIYSRIWNLDIEWRLHPECRHLPTKDKRYRNIILGNYLIIYRIKKVRILVLRILHEVKQRNRETEKQRNREN
ncbi:MAG: type II toxin-antitoxin system RelE/ParE family toxin [Balneolaceae bacterium]|nr:MAG: type II toxin-antitoxin system RelE/ParE family toxin [Balneolaceae bacterium]